MHLLNIAFRNGRRGHKRRFVSGDASRADPQGATSMAGDDYPVKVSFATQVSNQCVRPAAGWAMNPIQDVLPKNISPHPFSLLEDVTLSLDGIYSIILSASAQPADSLSIDPVW